MPDSNDTPPKEQKKRTLRDLLESSQGLAAVNSDVQRSMELERIRTFEAEKSKFREMQAQLQREFDEYRERTNAENIKRETLLQRERAELEKVFVGREAALRNKQKEFEELLLVGQKEVDSLRARLTAEVAQREAKLSEAQLELQLEKDRYNQENRERLDRTSKRYVVDAMESLQVQEEKFHRLSELWSRAGAGALVVGLVFFAAVTLTSLYTLPVDPTWELIVFSFVKGLIALTLLGALARYAFLLSNAYVREALKNSDRRHAINFGKFYLESYGAAADWTQVKEAFEHWNISGSNAFSEPETRTEQAATVAQLVPLLEKVSKTLTKPTT